MEAGTIPGRGWDARNEGVRGSQDARFEERDRSRARRLPSEGREDLRGEPTRALPIPVPSDERDRGVRRNIEDSAGDP